MSEINIFKNNMEFKFNYKNKKFRIDVCVCDNILSQARGLMFKKNSKPLLFIFKNKKIRTIHSFFCVPFVAVWFDGCNIVDAELINPWKISIKPKEKFDKLLEIPSNNVTFKEFIDEEKV